MAATKTLEALAASVVAGASIQGQTGSTGRHPLADIYALINTYIESCRSLVRTEGGEGFQVLDTIGTLPAHTAAEDFIEVAWPTAAEEVTGVDVLTSGSAKWQALDPADWGQRRSLNSEQSDPPGGVGWWTIKSLPEARASASVTAGVIALFPADLAGSYKVSYVEQWTPLTSTTHVWVCHADWETWVVSAVVMHICQQDNNKKGNYDRAERHFLRAQERIEKASGRVGPGYVVPTRVGGDWY